VALRLLTKDNWWYPFAWERKNMNIKKLLPVVILVVIGGAAFVYFDPLDLDLLGLKKDSVVAQHVVTPRVAAPVAQPSTAALKAAVAAAQAIAPVSAPSAAPSRTAAPVAPLLAAAPVVTKPVQVLEQSTKPSKPIKTAEAKPERSKTADLRYCLKLETNEAIAKCAGE
jgi:hypothetical protein